MKRLHSILAGLLLAAITTPAWAVQIPVSADTTGSPVTNKITKAAGLSPNLLITSKSTAFVSFNLSNTGLTSSQVTGARLVLYFSKVTKPGNITFAFNNSAFQEKFLTPTIPLPTISGAGGAFPITAAQNKSFLVVNGLEQVVQSWLDDPAGNFGLAITGDAAINVILASKETSVGAGAVLEIDVNPGGALNVASVAATGALSGGTLSTSNDVNVGDDLTVSGDIELNGIVDAGGTIFGGAFTTSGAVTGGSISTAGTLSAGSLQCNTTLNVAGQTTFNDFVTIANNKALTISGTGSLGVGSGGIATGGNIQTGTGNISTGSGTISSGGNITSNTGTIKATTGNILAGGKIGIGTTNPTDLLQIESTTVNPNITIKNTAGATFSGVNVINSAHSWYMGTNANANFAIIDNAIGATPFTIGGAAPFVGLVGIGITPIAGFRLAVGGSVFADSFITPSDARLKKEIEPLSGALDKVQKLRAVSYAWRQDEFPDRNFDNARHLGFIAQEIREVLPELVRESDGFLSVEYAATAPVLVGAIQDLKTQQDAEIANLRAANTALAAKVAALETRADRDAELAARLTRLETRLSSDRPAKATTTILRLK